VTDVDPGVSPDLIDPVAEYDRDEGLAIIGGFVYRGSQLPALEGRYVFGDFGRFNGTGSRLFYLNADNVIQEFAMADDTLQSMTMSGIGVDNDGELYVMGNTTGVPFGTTGRVFRLSPSTSEVIEEESNADTSSDEVGDEVVDDDNDSSGGGGSVGFALLSLLFLARISRRRRIADV